MALKAAVMGSIATRENEIFNILLPDNEAKNVVEFLNVTRNTWKIWRKMGNVFTLRLNEERSVLLLGSLVPSSYSTLYGIQRKK